MLDSFLRGAAILLVAGAIIAGEPAAAQEAEAGIPAWFRADIEVMTRDGGRWIADNDRRSEQEPYDQYGLEWRAAPDGMSMSGRLFGMRGGREVGDFWHFRQFWHPGEQRAYVMQWGAGGMYGVGEVTSLGEGSTMLDQTFYMLDGRTFGIGHMARSISPNERLTEQYDVVASQGAWRLNHAITWRRVAGR